MINPESDQPFTEEEALALRRAVDELVESQARIVWLGTESERLWAHREACERKRDELVEPFYKAAQERIMTSWKRKSVLADAAMMLLLCGTIPCMYRSFWKAPMTGFLNSPATALVLLGGTACWSYTPWIQHLRRERNRAKP